METEIQYEKTVVYHIKSYLQQPYDNKPKKHIDEIIEAITALEGAEPEIVTTPEGDVIAVATIDNTGRFQDGVIKSLLQELAGKQQALKEAIAALRGIPEGSMRG